MLIYLNLSVKNVFLYFTLEKYLKRGCCVLTRQANQGRAYFAGMLSQAMTSFAQLAGSPDLSGVTLPRLCHALRRG
jgi:hypothetical protein